MLMISWFFSCSLLSWQLHLYGSGKHCTGQAWLISCQRQTKTCRSLALYWSLHPFPSWTLSTAGFLSYWLVSYWSTAVHHPTPHTPWPALWLWMCWLAKTVYIRYTRRPDLGHFRLRSSNDNSWVLTSYLWAIAGSNVLPTWQVWHSTLLCGQFCLFARGPYM